MLNNSVEKIFWDIYMSEFVEFADFVDLGESKASQNKQVEIFNLEFKKDKKIFEDTDGEYVDFVDL